MKIWIDDIQGYLDGYSTMEQPNKIELEVEKEPTDFYNYRWNGTSLSGIKCLHLMTLK
ncbi:hypothetical protein [Enterococcus faecalis]|uniref:hypothetical protein n=1 Tax=Enterococcus faecalis TaxID=1351 RepID=UPI000B043860|nr:hypothetical protein [Enterococcus faecalis]